MFFDSYKNFPTATLNMALLWDYDINNFDFNNMRDVVVQRVVERGWPEDWYAILNRYGVDGVVAAIKNIPYLNPKDLNFVSVVFDIPLTEMKCYEQKPSRQQHWSS